MKKLHGRRLKIASGDSEISLEKTAEYRQLWHDQGYELPPAPSGIVEKDDEHGRKRVSLSRKVFNVISESGNIARSLSRSVSQEVVDRRMSMCLSCEIFDESSCECTHPRCGCKMKRKATLRYSECPVGFWGSDD